MNIHELNEIIDKRKEEIFEGNYSYNFYSEMYSNWNLLIKFLADNNFEYNEESKDKFLEYAKSIKNDKTYLNTIHSIEAINGLEFLKRNKFTTRLKRKSKEYDFGEYHNNIIRKYIEECTDYNSRKTVFDKNKTVIEITKFFVSKKIQNYNELKTTDIKEYINTYLQMDSLSNKKRYNWIFKDFLLFLYNNHFTSVNYSYLIDKLKTEKKKLPTIWNENETEKIIKSFPCFTPTEIRNKAMALLTIRLGIRACDVKNLKFENINWKENTITFIQSKTQKQVTLPLTEEVGSAIIYYIKKARPISDSQYIFLTHDGYQTKLSNSFSIRDYLIRTYKIANVDYLSKEKKGIHTFRHALASNMLKKGIPINIISSTLGHSNTNSTKIYIRIDTERLRECCLEVPYGE